jgi:hypothetical protein
MYSLGTLLDTIVHFSPLGAVLSAFAAAIALSIKVFQDAKGLRRKQAEVARQVYNDLHQDEYAMAALIMLDYPGWRHNTSDFSKVEIHYTDVISALETMHARNRTDKELLVRRSFDMLFAKLENVMVLSSSEINLVRWSDFAALFGFYVHLMRQDDFATFLVKYASQYGFTKIVELVTRNDLYPIPPFPEKMKGSAPSSSA